MKSSLITKSERETIDFAKKFLSEVLKSTEHGKPLILYLEGELGAGKTQFVKGVAGALGIKEKITSPTFVLMKKFKIPVRGGRTLKGGPGPPLPALRWSGDKKYFFHIDCYRIYDSEDAKQIGLDEIIKNPRAIVAIEWAERIAGIIPKPHWKLKFEHAGESKRKISIKNIK